MSDTELPFGLLGTAIDSWSGQSLGSIKPIGIYRVWVFGRKCRKNSISVTLGIWRKWNWKRPMITSFIKPLRSSILALNLFSSVETIPRPLPVSVPFATNIRGFVFYGWMPTLIINTPETSPSGNLHGMPVAGLLGLIDKNKWAMPWLSQVLKPNQFVQLGVRDIDEGEKRLVEELDIEYYSPREIRQKGLENLLKELSVQWKSHPVHLSFDIDSLSSELVPATATPVEKGLTLEEARLIIQFSHRHFDLISAEVVEFNPELAKTSRRVNHD